MTEDEACEAITRVKTKKPDRPWTMDVDVYLYDAGPPADFEIETCLPVTPNPPDKNPRIVFHNSGRDKGFTVRFRLFDNTRNGQGSGYVFPDPPGPKGVPHPHDWAMYSRQGHDCPPQGYMQQWDEFTSYEVQDNGTTLLVANKNETPTEFAYTLRVTNDDGANFVELDPGGTNMNGSHPWTWR